MKKVAEDERTAFHKEITRITAQMKIDAKANEAIKIYLEDDLFRFKEQAQKHIRELEKALADAQYQLKKAQAKSDSTSADFQNAKKIAEGEKTTFETELTRLKEANDAAKKAANVEKAKLMEKAEKDQEAIKKAANDELAKFQKAAAVDMEKLADEAQKQMYATQIATDKKMAMLQGQLEKEKVVVVKTAVMVEHLARMREKLENEVEAERIIAEKKLALLTLQLDHEWELVAKAERDKDILNEELARLAISSVMVCLVRILIWRYK